MKVYSRDCCTEGSVAEQRASAHYDRVNHGSVQPWSAGPLFPAVIAVVERYPDGACMQVGGCTYCDGPVRSYELMLAGQSAEYASREDAESVARALITDPALLERWKFSKRLVQ